MDAARPLAGQTALVAGASRGLGRALALALAARGARTILVARTVGALEEADDEARRAGAPPPTLVPLDLARTQDEKGRDPLRSLAGVVAERHGSLEMMVLVAAAPPPSAPAAHARAEDWERSLALHATAPLRALAAFEPLLRRAEGGARVLLVGDPAADGAPANAAAWAAPKRAGEIVFLSWAKEQGAFGTRANVALPTPFRSRLRAAGRPGEDPASLPGPEAAAAACLPLLMPGERRNAERVPVALAAVTGAGAPPGRGA